MTTPIDNKHDPKQLRKALSGVCDVLQAYVDGRLSSHLDKACTQEQLAELRKEFDL